MESTRRWEVLLTSYYSNAGWSQCVTVNSKPLWSHKAARLQPAASSYPLPSMSEGLSCALAHPAVIITGHQSLQRSATNWKLNKNFPQKGKVEEKRVAPNDRWNLFVKMFWRWNAKSRASLSLLFFRIYKSIGSSYSKAHRSDYLDYVNSAEEKGAINSNKK